MSWKGSDETGERTHRDDRSRVQIFSEHPAVANRSECNRDRTSGGLIGFMEYLWTEEAQRGFVKGHFQAVTSEALNDENKEFAKIKLPFTVDYFGGWPKRYPDVIEKVFREQVPAKVRQTLLYAARTTMSTMIPTMRHVRGFDVRASVEHRHAGVPDAAVGAFAAALDLYFLDA